MDSGTNTNYLYHASLLVTAFVGLLTLLGMLMRWRRERTNKKALTKNGDLLNLWLSRRGGGAVFDVSSGNPFYVSLLCHAMANAGNNGWTLLCNKLAVGPASVKVAVNGLTQEDTHLDAWLDVGSGEVGSSLELQLACSHPVHGKLGCTLVVQALSLKLKASFTQEDGRLYLSSQAIKPNVVSYRVTKKHPVHVSDEVLDSLNQSVDLFFQALSVDRFPLSQDAGRSSVAGANVQSEVPAVNGNAHEEEVNQQKKEVNHLPPEVPHPSLQHPSHRSKKERSSKDQEIAAEHHKPANLAIPEPGSETVDLGNLEQESGENSEVDRNTRSHSLSPGQPPSPWRRTRSYDNLDIIEVTPPTPRNGRPASKELHHSQSVVEPANRSLPYPNPNLLKRPSYPVGRGSSHSLDDRADSDHDTLSLENVSDSSSEETSVTSASDVSMVVYEVREGGTIKHLVVDSSRAFKRPPHCRKLHLFNGHVFAATHFKRFRHSVGPLTCSSCKKRVHGIVGKQAYQCRDCKMVVHKSCHGLVTVNCPKSSIESMMLLYQSDADLEQA